VITRLCEKVSCTVWASCKQQVKKTCKLISGLLNFTHDYSSFCIMLALLLCFPNLDLQRMQHLLSCPWQCLTSSWLGQQDAVQAKGQASAALQQAQQQQVQTSEHLALLSKQLAEERQQEAALSADVDNLQAELARYKTQVSLLHSVCT